VQQYFIDLLEERRRHGRDDLVTHFVRSDVDGIPFASEQVTPTSEVSGLMMVLFHGGVESTAGLTGNLFKLLAENPDQRVLLQRDPTLIPDALEEALRLITPLQLTARTTTREVTLHGVTRLCCVVRSQAMPKGTGALCWSDSGSEFVECGGQPEQRRGAGCKFVVTAA